MTHYFPQHWFDHGDNAIEGKINWKSIARETKTWAQQMSIII